MPQKIPNTPWNFVEKKPGKFITVTISAKTVFFRFSGEPGTGSGFFSLKPSWDQDKSNDMRYSPIGPAVFE